MTGLEIFKDVPVLTEENCEDILFAYDVSLRKKYFKNLTDCVSVLKKKYQDIVTGLWFIEVPAEDGGTQFVFRIKEELSDAQVFNKLFADISAFTVHELCYYMTNESVSSLQSLPVDEWIGENRVYALYDRERGIG